MAAERDPAVVARGIIDGGSYMTLATADEQGRPWASPVWYTPEGHTRFLWLSKPGARHSRNLEDRPEIAIVIFDSHEPGGWRAVYMEAVAERVPGDEVEAGIAAYSRRSEGRGMKPWTLADAQGDARHRLYHAHASEQFVLDEHDERIPVDLTA
jgi:nitroimidazol reductase NimA-like FMN-containing flavoprotein (pyridoxamine 5'-phosphate oxidase superfamily)